MILIILFGIALIIEKEYKPRIDIINEGDWLLHYGKLTRKCKILWKKS